MRPRATEGSYPAYETMEAKFSRPSGGKGLLKISPLMVGYGILTESSSSHGAASQGVS